MGLHSAITAMSLYLISAFTLTVGSLAHAQKPASTAQSLPQLQTKKIVRFWNGNKSDARRDFETQLLRLILSATEGTDAKVTLVVDNTDYPRAQDEGAVLDNGSDLLVTVAGNVKFQKESIISLPHPIAKGLLGYRILITRTDRTEDFEKISDLTDLKKYTIGIPSTWADAALFRYNELPVIEKGNYDTLFTRLKNGDFDYVALGANEIELAFQNRAGSLGGLTIESNILIYYPFPLVFYVNINQPLLAKRISRGLKIIEANGQYQSLFDLHYGDILKRLDLNDRVFIELTNPELPKSLKGVSNRLVVD